MLGQLAKQAISIISSSYEVPISVFSIWNSVSTAHEQLIKCGKISHCSCQRDVLNFVRFKLIKDPNLKTFFVWNMNEIRKQFEESSIKPISHEFSSLQTIYAGSMDHVWGGHPGTGAWRLLQLGLDHGLGQTCRSLWPTWQVELLVGLSWEWRVGLEGPACCQLCAFS